MTCLAKREALEETVGARPEAAEPVVVVAELEAMGEFWSCALKQGLPLRRSLSMRVLLEEADQGALITCMALAHAEGRVVKTANRENWTFPRLGE